MSFNSRAVKSMDASAFGKPIKAPNPKLKAPRAKLNIQSSKPKKNPKSKGPKSPGQSANPAGACGIWNLEFGGFLEL
jgi:hypothetical protein